MRPTDPQELERIRKAARILAAAVKPIKVLRAIEWDPAIRTRFFEQRAKELPRPQYVPFDPAPTQAALSELRDIDIASPFIADWIERQREAIETTALMMSAVGTADFYKHARKLYGDPKTPLGLYPDVCNLDLATQVRDVLDRLGFLSIDLTPPEYHSAEDVARTLKRACKRHFGTAAPTIEVVDVLSANALAGPTSIRVRRDAKFTDRDAEQLLQHEAFIHVATSLNGRAQKDLPILALSHPYIARFQEGLAVLAEVLTGAMEMDRFARLADRVFAIQKAIDGADFLEVYRYFLERTGKPEQAFQNTRRVFRGGVIEGGAPFTKDCVYLYGLIQASNTVRALFAQGRPDCLPLLFCGKVDVLDLRALCELAAMGLIKEPPFLPPWIKDPRSLFALLTYSTFMTRLDMGPIVEKASELTRGIPPVRFAP